MQKDMKETQQLHEVRRKTIVSGRRTKKEVSETPRDLFHTLHHRPLKSSFLYLSLFAKSARRTLKVALPRIEPRPFIIAPSHLAR